MMIFDSIFESLPYQVGLKRTSDESLFYARALHRLIHCRYSYFCWYLFPVNTITYTVAQKSEKQRNKKLLHEKTKLPPSLVLLPNGCNFIALKGFFKNLFFSVDFQSYRQTPLLFNSILHFFSDFQLTMHKVGTQISINIQVHSHGRSYHCESWKQTEEDFIFSRAQPWQ